MDAQSPLTPGRLGEHLGLTSGAVTACLDRLERAGHIRRVRESPDRRVVHLHYLPEARTTARAHFLPLAEATARAQEGFTPDELLSALRLLGAVSDELESLNKSALTPLPSTLPGSRSLRTKKRTGTRIRIGPAGGSLWRALPCHGFTSNIS